MIKMVSISLCLIVKNEEENLPRCLSSIKDYIDEIIIVDTGSEDNTIEIALSFGARVIEEAWQNNFSHARNVGLCQAKGEWILFLDADEEVMPNNLGQLRDLPSQTADGFFIQILNIDDKGNTIKQSALRLFRNNPLHRFRGSIHEQIIDSILEHNPEAQFQHLDLIVKHTGYQGKSITQKDKIQRNLNILNCEFEQGNQSPFLLFNLATEYLRSGDFPKALHFYDLAEPQLEPWVSYSHLLGKKKIQCLILLEDYQSALEVTNEYLHLYPDYTDLLFLKASIYYHKKDFINSLQTFRECLKLGEAPGSYVSEEGVGSFKAERSINRILELLKQSDIPEKRADLSLCLIVKNEQKNIARCIKSAKGVADEIIVVDTGSQDHTATLARKLGARVYNFDWSGNFAEARNFSLAMARSEWVLILDADETLRLEEHKQIRDIINKAGDTQGFYLKLINYFGTVDPDDYVVDAVCRLFRNQPEYQFAGAIHENISQSIIGAAGSASIVPTEIHIDHWGYLTRPILKKKNIRNTQILQQEVVKNNDPYTLYAMGTEFFQQAQYKDASSYYCEALRQHCDDGMLSDLYFKTAICYLEQEQYYQGVEMVKRGLQLFPDFASLWYLYGMLEYQQNNLEKACKIWQTTLATGDPPWHKYTFPKGIGTFRTAAVLAVCLEKMGQNKEAELLLEQFLEKRQGLLSIAPPYYRLLEKKYDSNKAVEILIEKIKPLDFSCCFILADVFNQLGRPVIRQGFIKYSLELLIQQPLETDFMKLAGMQLGIILKTVRKLLKSSPLPYLPTIKLKKSLLSLT
ncbi:hypothetical protein N752_21800 [Desulforamulus aquiferis]|nr:hypothetical protein N752_21800 [Desulforamulus aquiferis]